MMELRREIQDFAEEMEYKMALKDEERGDSWKRMAMEVLELKKAIEEKGFVEVTKEAADVANISMMIAWRAKEKWVDKAVATMFPEDNSEEDSRP
jgi:hypothetical protein